MGDDRPGKVGDARPGKVGDNRPLSVLADRGDRKGESEPDRATLDEGVTMTAATQAGHRASGTRLRFADAALLYRSVIRRALDARVPAGGRIGGMRGLTAVEWAVLNGILFDSLTWAFTDTSITTINELSKLVRRDGSPSLVRSAVSTLEGLGLVRPGPHRIRASVPFEVVADEQVLEEAPVPSSGPSRPRADRPQRRPVRTGSAAKPVPPANAGDVARVHAAFAEAQSRIWHQEPSVFALTPKDERAVTRALGEFGLSADQLVESMAGIKGHRFFGKQYKPLSYLLRDRDIVVELLANARNPSRRRAGGNIGEFGTDSSKSSVKDDLRS